ncbi:MAG: hypothetical protein DSY37_01975 [Hyperthermus sp.]|nr:MAG: hypothetical protein DSY37_01975 [Hyperthermus sp.]
MKGKSDEALRRANSIILPLMRAAKRYERLIENVRRRPARILNYYVTGDHRVYMLLIDLPASNPLLLVLYSSVQDTRPVAPSQLTRRYMRMRRIIEKWRGKLFVTADIVYLYLTKARLTRPAYRLAKEMRLYVALSVEKAREMLSKYLIKRYNRLKKTKERRSRPELLALLKNMLYHMSQEISVGKPLIRDGTLQYPTRLIYSNSHSNNS